MNLDALKNIKIDINSLKNFSIEDVRNFINEQQVLALNIVMAVASVIVGFFVIHMRLEEYLTLKQSLADLNVKEEPARRYEKLLKEKKSFLAAVPPSLSEENVIPYLTQLADRRGAIINELQPPYEKIEGFFREVKVVFVCTVPNFHDALLFVNDLENSKYMLKINSWSLSPKEKEMAMEDPRARTGLTMSLDVSSMRLMVK